MHLGTHGGPQSHELAGVEVDYQDYLDLSNDVVVRGFTFEACHTCNYLYENCLGSTVCFNPESETLWVLGFGAISSPGAHFFDELGAGQSIGESFKEALNEGYADQLKAVFFGDGTIRPPHVTWTGGAQVDDWSDSDNWDIVSGYPDDDDHVWIPDDSSDPTVDVNVGSYDVPQRVSSVRIVQGGSSGDVTINVQTEKGLSPRGPVSGRAKRTTDGQVRRGHPGNDFGHRFPAPSALSTRV